MADQANAPAPQTPPPAAPEGSAAGATPAPSNVPVGLALDLPGKFGPGWTVSGTNRDGSIVLSKPSGDGVTTISISSQTLDRAKQLTWNRNRKPTKQKLTRRSVQFGGIRTDVAGFDAASNRYLMTVQDATGQTVTKWIDAKTAEKLNNRDISEAVKDFAKEYGATTDFDRAKKERGGETKPMPSAANKPTSPKTPAAETIQEAIEKEAENAIEEETEKDNTASEKIAKNSPDRTEEFAEEMRKLGINISEKQLSEHKEFVEKLKAENRSKEEEEKILKGYNQGLGTIALFSSSNAIEKINENLGKSEREKEQVMEKKEFKATTRATEETSDLGLVKNLEEIDPRLQDSAHAGDEQAAKVLARIKSLQALELAPTVEATFTQIAKGTSVENLSRTPANNDPKRREYDKYQDLAKQIYEAHRARLRKTEDVSFEADALLKAVARNGKTVNQAIQEREFDRYYESVIEAAQEQGKNSPEAARTASLDSTVAAGTGLTAASRNRVTGLEAPIAKAVESAILPTVREIAAGLVGNANTAGTQVRSPAPRSVTPGALDTSVRVQATPTSTPNPKVKAAGTTQASGDVTVKSTSDLSRQIKRTITTKGEGRSKQASIEVTVSPEVDASQTSQAAPLDSVDSTIRFLRAQNRDRFTSPPPFGPIYKAAGAAIAIGAVPLGAMFGSSAGAASRPGTRSNGQASSTRSGSLRVSLPNIPAPQQLRVEQYVRSSANLTQRESQLQGFEQQHAPILEEFDGLLSMEDRSPAQESRLQQIQAEHGDTVLRPRELLQSQVQAGRDNIASLKQAGAKEGFDIPALAAPFMPGAAPTVPQAISPSAPSVETVSAALPTPKPTGIPSIFRPVSGRPRPAGQRPGGGLRGGDGGMTKVGNILPSRPAGNPVSQFAQAQQQDRMSGGEDAREASLGSEGGSGLSPIETIPQTYGAEPTQEKSERQRQADMLATRRQMTGGLPQEAGERQQVGGVTIERKAATEADAYKRLRDDSQRRRGSSITRQSSNQPRPGGSLTQQALQKYGGAAGAAAGLAANSGVDLTAQAKKQIRRAKWEMLLSVEGSPLYFLAGAGQFFGKIVLGNNMPEELKTEWWEDLLCGTLFLGICLLIVMVCMFIFALLAGFAIYIDPRQYANAALRWVGL